MLFGVACPSAGLCSSTSVNPSSRNAEQLIHQNHSRFLALQSVPDEISKRCRQRHTL